MGHSPTNFDRILRIPARIGHDIKTIFVAKNWREILRAKLGGKPLDKVQLRNGATLESPAEVDLLFLFHEIWIDKIYELAGYEIKAGDTVIDIGGNIGAFVLFAAGRAPNVKIYSYEPFPANAEYLRRNIAASKLENVFVAEKAVAGDPGRRSLRVDDSWVRHSLGENGPEGGGLTVNCTSLDDIIKEVKHCDLLKIDCEGGEYEIFYRCQPETLRSIDKVICEYHDGEQGTGEKLKEFFEANDFTADVFRAFGDTTGLLCVKRNK
jgi:FkbM family methyltransferase